MALQAIEMLPALRRPSITDYLKDEKGWDYRDLPHRKSQRAMMSWKAEYHLRNTSSEQPTVYEYGVELQPRRCFGVGKELLAMVQRIFPRVEAVKSTGKQGWAWHHLAITERIGADTIEYPAEQASDGFLRMLAVFSLKYFANPPRIITLEEPENGVHPQLISQVIDHLKALADRKEPNKVQVFMTSHSPYVLNEFGERSESVHIFEKGRYDDVPRVIPLTERKQVLTAADGLNRSLGDLWYSKGFREVRGRL